MPPAAPARLACPGQFTTNNLRLPRRSFASRPSFSSLTSYFLPSPPSPSSSTTHSRSANFHLISSSAFHCILIPQHCFTASVHFSLPPLIILPSLPPSWLPSTNPPTCAKGIRTSLRSSSSTESSKVCRQPCELLRCVCNASPCNEREVAFES